ncbi:MAG: hypothetical protein IKL72_01165 [Firmicutes bacterium]|nr:hypothetical protein [Bacillota bacterium]
MKKCLILVLCLLLISTCSIFAAHSIIDPKQDQVQVEETVLSGDVKAAEGLSVTTHIGASGHLFWDTCCKLGEDMETSTDFRFSHKEEHHFEYIDDQAIMLEMENDFSAGGIIDYEGLNDAIKHVADNTGPSERHEETVDLKDYYDFFPLDVRIGMSHCFFDSTDPFYEEPDAQGILTTFNEFFRFPITGPYLQSVTVQKDMDGNIIELQVTSADNACFYLETISEVSKNNCWFTFKFQGDTRPGTGSIPGGYGIYCLPFSDAEEGDPNYSSYPIMVHPEDLKNAYPLSENAEVMDLYYSEKFDRLFLTTIEDGWHWVTVLDGSTGEELQRFKSMPEYPEGSTDKGQTVESMTVSADDTGVYKCFYQKDLMVIMDINGRFAVIEIDEKGFLKQVLVTEPLTELHAFALDPSTPQEEYRFDFSGQTGLAWDGEKLAVSSYINKFHPMTGDASYYMMDSCDFFVLVIDEEGLQYAGIYDTSLDTGAESSYAYGWYGLDYYDLIVPLESTPVTVDWK